MAGRVVVVGSVNVDFVVAAPRLPKPGETVVGGRFERHQGGKGANQAVAAARLGARVELVGAVADDDLGAEALDALEADGVGVAELERTQGASTGVAVIIVDADGENLIAVASGANATLSAAIVGASLERLALGPADVLLAGCEIPVPGVREALRVGRAAGATTILNPAPAGGLDRRVLGLADVLTPNRGELAELVGAEARRIGRRLDSGTDRPERGARSLLEPSSEGPPVGKAVIVTLGAAGALLVRPGGSPLALPVPDVSAVDAVGAGDAFNGALAALLAAGAGIEVGARRAVVAGALATTRRGARAGMPTLPELDAAG